MNKEGKIGLVMILIFVFILFLLVFVISGKVKQGGISGKAVGEVSVKEIGKHEIRMEEKGGLENQTSTNQSSGKIRQ